MKRPRNFEPFGRFHLNAMEASTSVLNDSMKRLLASMEAPEVDMESRVEAFMEVLMVPETSM